ncbi:hypothetical protein FKP32DRAFT_1390584 [Trametes sanguinea]|nr:hypothetical protein FKP32DRAFT_1390584 [Trametes sanguinea]
MDASRGQDNTRRRCTLFCAASRHTLLIRCMAGLIAGGCRTLCCQGSYVATFQTYEQIRESRGMASLPSLFSAQLRTPRPPRPSHCGWPCRSDSFPSVRSGDLTHNTRINRWAQSHLCIPISGASRFCCMWSVLCSPIGLPLVPELFCVYRSGMRPDTEPGFKLVCRP